MLLGALSRRASADVEPLGLRLADARPLATADASGGVYLVEPAHVHPGAETLYHHVAEGHDVEPAAGERSEAHHVSTTMKMEALGPGSDHVP